MTNLLKFSIVFLIFSSNVLAQGSRWGLLVNSDNKECARFWEGNDCEKVTVPNGWKPLFPDWNEKDQRFKISFEGKGCNWSGTEPDKCCTDLGFKYNKDFKAPSRKTGLEKNPNSFCYQLPEKSPPK